MEYKEEPTLKYSFSNAPFHTYSIDFFDSGAFHLESYREVMSEANYDYEGSISISGDSYIEPEDLERIIDCAKSVVSSSEKEKSARNDPVVSVSLRLGEGNILKKCFYGGDFSESLGHLSEVIHKFASDSKIDYEVKRDRCFYDEYYLDEYGLVEDSSSNKEIWVF